MNIVKATYIVCSLLMQLAFFFGAVLIPVYVTPGFYYWSIVCILLFSLSNLGFSKRVDGWDDF